MKKAAIALISILLMQIDMVWADDNNTVQKAVSKARAYSKDFLAEHKYEEFCYQGTVGQYLLSQYKNAEHKYISTQGSVCSIEDLPSDALVIYGCRRRRKPVLGGGCYIYCDSKSGEVIGFILMK